MITICLNGRCCDLSDDIFLNLVVYNVKIQYTLEMMAPNRRGRRVAKNLIRKTSSATARCILGLAQYQKSQADATKQARRVLRFFFRCVHTKTYVPTSTVDLCSYLQLNHPNIRCHIQPREGISLAAPAAVFPAM